MWDHKLNEDIREELGIIGSNTVIKPMEGNG
jgi:hypothetical protein